MFEIPTSTVNDLKIGEYQDQIQSAGYVRLSFGAFAMVYAHPDKPNEVLKMGEANSDGYLQFVSRVGLNSRNPHFPRITSVELFDNEPTNPCAVPYYVVRMEKLNVFTRQHEEACYEQVGINSLCDLGEFGLVNYQPVSTKMEKVKHTLKMLYRTHVCDMKSSNVMVRHTQTGIDLVFTDPVACFIGE